MCVTFVKMCSRLFGMKISNTEIARLGLCTEGAVRAAISSGRLDVENAESVFGFALVMRSKSIGFGIFDGLVEKPESKFPNMVTADSLGIDKKPVIAPSVQFNDFDAYVNQEGNTL